MFLTNNSKKEKKTIKIVYCQCRNVNIVIFPFSLFFFLYNISIHVSFITGTFVVQVTATDADDPTYGNSAKVVYSILQGQPYFSVESETG